MTTSGTSINVLEGLTTEEVARFVASCEQSTHSAGEAIFTEGDEGDDVYIVRSGRVRISKAISLDVDHTLTVLTEGGIFGELAIVGEGARSASAVAEQDTTVLALSKQSFVTLTEEAPALGLKVMGRFAAMLAERLRVTTDLLRDTVQWGLDVSGASGLGLQQLIQAQARLTLTLVNGDVVTGNLLSAEKNDVGMLLTIAGPDDRLHLIPYHAIVSFGVAKSVLGGEE